MAITHEATKVPGERGFASEWNADHVVDDDSKPKNNTTLIVAASNSLDRTRADYVCDGIDDQDEINEALNDLPAHGGRVSLLDGTYQTTAPIVIPDDDVTLVGLGANTTIQTSDNISLVVATGRDRLLINSLHIIGSDGASNIGIALTNCKKCHVTDCWVEHCTVGIRVSGTSHQTVVFGNWCYNNVEEGIYMMEGDYYRVESNYCSGNGADGIRAFSSNFASIINNRCMENVENGIHGDILQNSIVAGNTCHANDSGNTATFSGIYIENVLSNYNIIDHNKCMDNDNFEIDIGAGTRNIVTSNQLAGTDHVGGLNDAGTNTIKDNNNETL